MILYRHASPEDAAVLASMNAQLIRDEGHRNAMSEAELVERMEGWLRGEYRAVLFELDGRPVGYALYREEPEYVYLRQLFVCEDMRRRGVGRGALDWMRQHAWPNGARVHIDVLVGNQAGIQFWRSAGFVDYCLTMESA